METPGNARHILGVSVSGERLRQFQSVLQSVYPCGDECGAGKVGVGIRARDTLLKSQRGSVSDDADGTGAVVPSPSDGGGSE